MDGTVKVRDPAAGSEMAANRDIPELQKLSGARTRILTEIRKVIVGQEAVIDLMLISLFSRGHSLFVGVPGLAKTRLVSTLAEVLDLSFNRIQFTPDLMPSDITGTDILQEDPVDRRRGFVFMKGPIFCNLLLADEINRTPPKTQAALLQAMQESQVTAGGRHYALQPPFFVFATQNPIEQEGTYPLPEAQLDRFLFQIDVTYPSFEEEVRIAEIGQAGTARPEKVMTPAEILALQEFVREIPIAPHLLETAVHLIRRTRPTEKDAPEYIRKYVAWGAGPRATQNLVIAAKARAALQGRYAVAFSDFDALLPAILQHRLILNFHADADNIRVRDLIEKLIAERANH